MEAWVEVARQLPAEEFVPPDEQRRRTSEGSVTESEGEGETGANDTAETDDLIRGFGTGRHEQRAVTITGSL